MQTQVWPLLRNLELSAPCTAASRSASSKTMKGALPPSSRLTFLMVSAHWAISSLPIPVEPVKESFCTNEFPVSSAPISRDLVPGTMFSTPAGIPARSPSAASAKAESGVSEAGLSTTVQPAASAGPTLRVIMALGKFQGVMAATTPMACLITTRRRPCLSWGMTSP
ncbi:hypothetical protein FQZ97_839320 [compost metagenome]